MLAEHMNVHTDQRPMLCSFCPKTFKSKQYLDQHSAIHLDEHKILCPTCGKCFKFNSKNYNKNLFSY